jgi:hypothetical protein
MDTTIDPASITLTNTRSVDATRAIEIARESGPDLE